MPRGRQIDPGLLQAALEGLEHRLAETNEKIAAVKKLLRTGVSAAPPEEKQTTGRRPRKKMSAAARKRIAEAQKKRWAEFRAKTARKGRKAAATESQA